MKTEFQHINNVYISVAQRDAHKKINTLVIETDVDMPRSGDLASHMQMDSLLMEVNTLKERCPNMFESVDYVEIRRSEPEIFGNGNYIYAQSLSRDIHTRH